MSISISTIDLLDRAKDLAESEMKKVVPSDPHLSDLRVSLPEVVQLEVLEYHRKGNEIRFLPALVRKLLACRWADYCEKQARRRKVHVVDPSNLMDVIDSRHPPASFHARRQEEEEGFRSKISGEDYEFMREYESTKVSRLQMMKKYDLTTERAVGNRYHRIQVKLGLLPPPRPRRGE